MTTTLIYNGKVFQYDGQSVSTINPPYRNPFILIYRGVKILVDPNIQASTSVEQPKTYELTYRGVKHYVTR